MNTNDLHAFEQARAGLMGIARRILASQADAEDAVQDCFLRWHDADREAIASPAAWLSTVCSRRCLDVRRAASRARVDYVGASLEESTHPAHATQTEHESNGSLDLALRLTLERLTPKERAAWLLHEVFERPVPEIAAALRIKVGAAQKLIERSRANIASDRRRRVATTSSESRTRLMSALRAAVGTGDVNALTTLLAQDAGVSASAGERGHEARSANRKRSLQHRRPARNRRRLEVARTRRFRSDRHASAVSSAAQR